MIDKITIQPGKVHKYLSRNDGGLQHKKSWSAIECMWYDTSNNDTVILLKDKVKDLFHMITATTSFISRIQSDLK